MKKTMILSAMALIALAACNKESHDVITPEMTTSYAKVSISMAGGFGTRAAAFNGFDYGTGDEAKVEAKDITLVLYDDNDAVVGTGKYVSTPADKDFSLKSGSSAGNIENTGNAVFKLTLTEGAALPTKVIAFVNTDAVQFNLNDLSVAGNIVDAYKRASDGRFVMTNAGYYKGSAYTIASELESNYFFATEAGALAATTDQLAATINVERLAAKVTVQNKAKDESSDKYVITTPGGDETVTIKFVPKKWAITGKARDMYLLKKNFKLDNTWMNAAGDFRSYWAEGTNWDVKYMAPAGYTVPVGGKSAYYLDSDAKNLDVLEYVSYKAVKNGIDFNGSDYTLENTYNYEDVMNGPRFNPAVPSTSVLIYGQYEISINEVLDEETYTDGFYLLYTGADGEKAKYTIYTADELVTYLKGGKILYNGNTVDASVVSDFIIIKNENGKFALAPEEGDKLYTKNEEGVYEEYTKETNARHYVESEGYFYVPIEHYTSDPKSANGDILKNGYYGVIRNHSYVLTINSITGLAVPLDEDHTDHVDDPIYPEPDVLNDAYINATINVLSWHVVNQGVDL